MHKYLLIAGIISLSCSESTINEPISSDTKKQSNGMDYYFDGDVYIKGNAGIGCLIKPSLSLKPESMGSVSGWVSSGYFKGGFVSMKDSPGKTYTEEFEDKQGNIRTRVYENGLLVSYKINGVEQ